MDVDVIEKFWICKLWLLYANVADNAPQLTYDCAKIMDNLYIGSLYSICPDSLQYHKFDAIINVSSEIKFSEIHLNYMKININDCEREFIYTYFEDVNVFIKSKKKVLLHCNAGISRSATFAIAYLIGECKFSLTDAIRHVKSMRAIIFPNDGFLVQLILYEHHIYQKYPSNSIITEAMWIDAMFILGLYQSTNNEDDDDLPVEWKNLYKLGFSSIYKKK